MQEKESRCSPASAPATTRGMGTVVEKLEDYALNRQGRTIYNVQSGLVPNYCGHVPGTVQYTCFQKIVLNNWVLHLVMLSWPETEAVQKKHSNKGRA